MRESNRKVYPHGLFIEPLHEGHIIDFWIDIKISELLFDLIEQGYLIAVIYVATYTAGPSFNYFPVPLMSHFRVPLARAWNCSKNVINIKLAPGLFGPANYNCCLLYTSDA